MGPPTPSGFESIGFDLNSKQAKEEMEVEGKSFFFVPLPFSFENLSSFP